MAKSLNASVGPWNSSSRNRLSSIWTSGAVAACRKSAIGVLGHRVEFVSRQIVADEGRDDACGGIGVG